jgi:hypothetical protein
MLLGLCLFLLVLYLLCMCLVFIFDCHVIWFARDLNLTNWLLGGSGGGLGRVWWGLGGGVVC